MYMYSVKWELWSVECKSVRCAVESAECGVKSVECQV